MTALALQTVLLMAVAYFLGAALACFIRRSFFRPVVASLERRVDPLPEYAARTPAPASAARPIPVAPLPSPPSPTPPAPVAPVRVVAQDLKRIQLIDPGTEARLQDLGVTRYEQIAAWTRAEVQRVSKALGATGRIARENWIEQAQILAKGGETYYSARRARGETATAIPTLDDGSVAAPVTSPSSAEPLPRPMSRAGVAAVVVAAPAAVTPRPAAPPSTEPALVSERAAFAQTAAPDRPSVAVPVRPAPPPDRDGLQRIGGISAEFEQVLNANGVTRYAQVAQWSAADVERFEGLLGAGGRIARENWIEQAHILSRGGDTRSSREFDRPGPLPTRLADAIRGQRATSATAARTDLGSLRSVRSEAYQNATEPGPEAARRVASRTPAGAGGPEDLKRIRGIGVLIEKRLNAMGVTSYEHIANWTAGDIDRVSQSLDFKGRIERENWVEQARILSAGGHTEFSRRVDRGEVETSRPKV